MESFSERNIRGLPAAYCTKSSANYSDFDNSYFSEQRRQQIFEKRGAQRVQINVPHHGWVIKKILKSISSKTALEG